MEKQAAKNTNSRNLAIEVNKEKKARFLIGIGHDKAFMAGESFAFLSVCMAAESCLAFLEKNNSIFVSRVVENFTA